MQNLYLGSVGMPYYGRGNGKQHAHFCHTYGDLDVWDR
jgi:hypothetical protein